MRRTLGGLILAALGCLPQVFAEEFPCRYIATQSDVLADNTGVRGNGRVACYDEYTNLYAGQYTAKTWVIDLNTGATLASDSCKCDGQKVWNGVANGGPATDKHCYRDRTSGASSFFQQETGSSQVCYSETPPPSSEQTGDGGGCPYANCNSPILINLGNSTYRLSGSSDPVTFDIDGDGHPDRIGWSAAGAAEAFLALDRNGNGSIDDGTELFGNHTPLAAGGVAPNGFEALAQYDSNRDHRVDPDDPVWSSLLLWTDSNHDGVSQKSELLAVQASDVQAIAVDYRWTGRRDESGNTFRYKSTVWMTGAAGQPVPRPVYDIFFVSVP